MDFGSENTSPVHAAFVDALAAANVGYATNFEDDNWTDRALQALRAFFEHDRLSAFTVSTGTAANAIALAAMTPHYGAILCHFDAHTVTDECGAPEFLSGGARQILIAGEHGRMSVSALSSVLAQARLGVVHAVQPKVLSLTNLTESGTAYTPDQISELAAIARQYGLAVHLDGARFANALVATGASPAEMSWRAGVDVLTLGATKSGAFGAETIVAFNTGFDTEMAFVRKRSGHFAPKSRFLAAQVLTYIEDDLWRRNAEHANRQAARLAAGLQGLEGVSLVHPPEGNEVFVSMPEAMTAALLEAGCRFQRDWRMEPRQNRFVTSWFTSNEDVDNAIAVCQRVAGTGKGSSQGNHGDHEVVRTKVRGGTL